MAGETPLHADIVWNGNLEFAVTSGRSALAVDGDGTAGPTPMQLLGMALLGCMAIDVVNILRKGRHPLEKLHASMTAERAPDPPRRFLKVQLHFGIHGEVPANAVERAIALSREKYCSVWHSLRDDIELTVTFDVLAAP
jgi:putative redox protein